MSLWGPFASLKKHGFLIYNDICALCSDAGLSEVCVLDGFILPAQGHVAVERELPYLICVLVESQQVSPVMTLKPLIG